jgi:hypothetical protein
VDASLVAIVAGLATTVLVVVAARNMSRSGGGVSSGLANAAADLDAILQPNHPTAEVIEKAKATEEEGEDEGDPKDPPPRRSDAGRVR